MESVDDMLLVIEIADSGSFTQASVRLGLPKSTISNRVSQLEKRLGLRLFLISRGMRNVDVSEQLSLSGNTVATHIKSIYRKLGIFSRAEASWYAAMLGLAPGKAETDEMPVADPAAAHDSNNG